MPRSSLGSASGHLTPFRDGPGVQPNEDHHDEQFHERLRDHHDRDEVEGCGQGERQGQDDEGVAGRTAEDDGPPIRARAPPTCDATTTASVSIISGTIATSTPSCSSETRRERAAAPAPD